MTRPEPDEQPTTVLPAQTAEQPAVSTAPATRRAGLWSHVPSRIGRARTSTVIIGCLFVLLFALNSTLPRDEGETATVTTSDGRTFEVPKSALPDDYVPPTPTPAAPTTAAPTTSRPSATTTAPRTTTPRSTTAAPAPDDEETPAPETTDEEPSQEAPASSSAPATSRAPSSSAARTTASPTS